MQAQTIDARIMLTILTFVFALAVVVGAPLATMAADGPDDFPMCWTGSYVTYLECVEANGGPGGVRGTASVARPEIVRDTVTDYGFMEQNTWGEHFVFAPTGPHFPNAEDATFIQDGMPTY